MTYGEFLRTCRILAGVETKSEFSRKLGFKDPDHYIGSENDSAARKPSLDLLERAAELAGLHFEDCIKIPEASVKKTTKEHDKTHRQLQEILENGGDAADWISGNIHTFHRAYVVSRRRRRKDSK